MANLFSYQAALGYKQSSLSIQKMDGQIFIETDVCPQAGDTILDLGCGTGELSAYLAELVGPEGKVVAVDPDKERITFVLFYPALSSNSIPNTLREFLKCITAKKGPRLSNIVPLPDFTLLRVMTRIAYSRFSKPLTAF